jgi:PelA/Pel-15E family pectate lyase
MNWPWQTTEVQHAIQAGIQWYQNNRISNLRYNKKTGQFEVKSGKRFWYRFYEIKQDTPFFCGRDGIKKYSIAEVEWERRTGYGWGGDYAGHLLKAAKHLNMN